MPLSRPSKRFELFDPVRKKWIVSSPEEKVRQRCLSYLIDHCEFPREVITVEKALAHLSLISRQYKRRCDLLCYGPKLAFPLLLIECKTAPLRESMFPQLWGYNAYIKAPFVALVNREQLKMEWKQGGQSKWCDFIPSYRELIKRCTS